ncbi:hypothetical protein OSTOST_21970 [Ostertagia ostertagi]
MILRSFVRYLKTSRSMQKTVLVFDVDGTLTPARQKMHEDIRQFMMRVRQHVPVAVVGGSDLAKNCRTVGRKSRRLFLNRIISSSLPFTLLSRFDFVFSENGLVGFKGKQMLPSKIHIGEEKLQKLINFVLRYFSEITLPVKRGNFRRGMLNFSPIGRSCSQAERDQFVVYDKEHKIREKFVKALEEKFSEYGLCFVIGGQISVDAYPVGWDKTYCLQFIEKDFDTIHFFGDKTMPVTSFSEVL